MTVADKLRRWAQQVKSDVVALWFAVRHPAAPWYVRSLGAFVVAYALSPIDLIPDFIPVLGYLDDLLLLPGLIWLAVRLLPPQVLAECRSRADMWMKAQGKRPSSRLGAWMIVLLWIMAGTAVWIWLLRPWP